MQIENPYLLGTFSHSGFMQNIKTDAFVLREKSFGHFRCSIEKTTHSTYGDKVVYAFVLYHDNPLSDFEFNDALVRYIKGLFKDHTDVNTGYAVSTGETTTGDFLTSAMMQVRSLDPYMFHGLYHSIEHKMMMFTLSYNEDDQID